MNFDLISVYAKNTKKNGSFQYVYIKIYNYLINFQKYYYPFGALTKCF